MEGPTRSLQPFSTPAGFENRPGHRGWGRVLGARLLRAVADAGGGAVMGTGIVSIGLALDQQPTLSRILLAIAVVLWLGLLVLFVRSALWQRPRLLEAACTPDALTAVAGTAVLGDRLTLLGETWAGYLLLVLALCLGLALLPRVLRHWTTPTVGVSFMLTVALESLAVLAALLATEGQLAWLAASALVPLALGLGAYLFVLARVDLRQLRLGRGDHWIFGGALAIATFACARTTAALTATSTLTNLQPALDDVTLALWAAAALWLPALLVAELIAPRIGYDPRRWSTVFPLGMYAVGSIATGGISGIGGVSSFGRVWIWFAFAIWALVFVGMLSSPSGSPCETRWASCQR